MPETRVEEFDFVEVNRETALIEYERNLTEDDIVAKAVLMADLDAEIDRIKSEKDVAVAGYNSKIKDRSSQIQKGLKVIKEGFEVIEEECTFEFLWNDGVVEYYSLETGEVVKTREITKEERQMKLFDEKKAPEPHYNIKESIPKCHMKDMILNEGGLDAEGITILPYWECSICGSKKDR